MHNCATQDGKQIVFAFPQRHLHTFFGPTAVPKLVDCSHPGLQPSIEIGAHRHTCVSKGLAREQQCSRRKVQWLSDPCILKHGTRIVLNPAVFWGKTILPGYAPAHLSAWDTSAHRHTSVGEQISSPPTYHPQPPANHSWCKCTMCPPYLAPVLLQSGLQLQGQLQEPVLHLDKAGVTHRLGLCSHCTNTRAVLCTLGDAGGGSDWNGQTIVRPHITSRP